MRGEREMFLANRHERELQRQAAARQAQIVNQVRYRSGLRNIVLNEQAIRSVIEESRRSAVEAERRGDHARAVGCARMAKNMESQLYLSTSIRTTLEAACAVNENAAAFKQVLGSTGLMNGLNGAIDRRALCAAQANADYIREQLNANGEYCNDMLALGQMDAELREVLEAEAELQRIMRSRTGKARRGTPENTPKRRRARAGGRER